MAQYRALHTKITQSFDFNEMPDDFTRLMWALMPLALDSEGRGIYNSSWLRSKLFPLREDVTAKQIMAAMDWIVERGMIIKYEVDGRQYFYSPTFKSYQRGLEKETKSVLPAPELVESNSVPTPEQLQSNSRPTPELGESNSLSNKTELNLTETELNESEPEKLISLFSSISKVDYVPKNLTERKEWSDILQRLARSGVTADIMARACEGKSVTHPAQIISECGRLLNTGAVIR